MHLLWPYTMCSNMFLPSLKAHIPKEKHCEAFTLCAGSTTPCSRYHMKLLLLVWNTFTRIFCFWLLGKNEWDERQTCFWNNTDFASRELCLCLYLCVYSKATRRHPLVLWAMETALTKVDPKTKVSEHNRVNKFRITDQLSQVVVLVLVLFLTSAAYLFLCCSDGWGQQWVIDDDHR